MERWGLTSESGGTVLLDKPKYVTQCSSRTFQAENIVCFLLYPTLLLPFYEGKNSRKPEGSLKQSDASSRGARLEPNGVDQQREILLIKNEVMLKW